MRSQFFFTLSSSRGFRVEVSVKRIGFAAGSVRAPPNFRTLPAAVGKTLVVEGWREAHPTTDRYCVSWLLSWRCSRAERSRACSRPGLQSDCRSSRE
jgi:hypothetical protein